MPTVGLTGSIACGKSAVSKMLARKGAYVIDLDQVAREVVQPGTAAWLKIVSFFGQDVLAQDGNLDRGKLGQIIFADVNLRMKLNEITHGPIIKKVLGRKQKFFSDPNNAEKLLVIMAPLLIEAGMNNMVDMIIVVICREEIQKKRLMERENINEIEAERRIRSQMPPEEKNKYADFIIDNSGSLNDTAEQVDHVWVNLSSKGKNI
ncbi:dephospho-CoA kinase [Candidatus Contubernalis alkaliaceticus]|uniref:dephospho-CoA kinase n=1 Tax=Candidatus Contubernalis alkaliaceticus TaxID=338645 RepID=UPI001F4C3C6B|nr:dephospho-CoA kinase [Candidatus Contubernalis alkalaceticus]UNC91599.1 dephospho-CoA kinase [Candidatus Contubernalis alkalaceticus]